MTTMRERLAKVVDTLPEPFAEMTSRAYLVTTVWVERETMTDEQVRYIETKNPKAIDSYPTEARVDFKCGDDAYMTVHLPGWFEIEEEVTG